MRVTPKSSRKFSPSPRSRPPTPTISPKPSACGCTNDASSSRVRAAWQIGRVKPLTPPRRRWPPPSRPARQGRTAQSHRLVLRIPGRHGGQPSGVAQDAAQAPFAEHDGRDAGEDPGVEGTGGERLAAGRRPAQQTAGLCRPCPDAASIDDRAHRAAAPDCRNHLLSAGDAAGADRHGAAPGLAPQPGPVSPRRREGREATLTQRRRGAATEPEGKGGPS